MIGQRTQIGPGVQILTDNRSRDPRDASLRLGVWPYGPHREQRFDGAGAIILPGVSIGDDAVIGAGSAVTRDVSPGATAVGNPARVWT